MSRPETRYRVNLRVQLTWQDPRGLVRRCAALCVDLSASGARLETIDPIPVRGLVTFQFGNFGRMAHATVRYCRRQGMKYNVGIQFTTCLNLGDEFRREAVERTPGGKVESLKQKIEVEAVAAVVVAEEKSV